MSTTKKYSNTNTIIVLSIIAAVLAVADVVALSAWVAR